MTKQEHRLMLASVRLDDARGRLSDAYHEVDAALREKDAAWRAVMTELATSCMKPEQQKGGDAK